MDRRRLVVALLAGLAISPALLPLGEPDAAEIPLFFGFLIGAGALGLGVVLWVSGDRSRTAASILGLGIGASLGWVATWFVVVPLFRDLKLEHRPPIALADGTIVA